ncbi:MAG: peptidase S9 [Sphingobacteriales bacterium 40-81]|nr:MAG: peptidase S9 [Sphingobacteriales bacterium 40-81]
MFNDYMLKKIIFLTCFIALGATLFAQQTNPAYRPTREEMLERYRQATVSDSTINRGKIFNLTVQPTWLDDGKAFWYRRAFKDSVREYVLVNAATGKRQPLFDHAKLAASLSKQTGQNFNPQKLLLTNIKVNRKKHSMAFEMNNKVWHCDLGTYAVTDSGTVIANEAQTIPWWRRNNRRSRWWGYKTDSISPDKQLMAFIKEGNVFIQPVNGDDAIQHTTDGTAEKPYGSLAWSPDSKYVVGYKITPYKDSLVYYVLTSQANTTRGQLKSQEYKQPGDPFTTYEMFAFSVMEKKTTKINTEIIDFFPEPYLNWRKDDATHFLYEKVDRGHQRFRIIDVDVKSGETKTIVDEQTNTFIYEQKIYTEYLPETNEIIWATEKDGWRHIYLVNSLTGEMQPVTKGDWVVRDIDSINAKSRQIWFRASGLHADEDPYFVHYYRINFDGSNLLELTPEKGNHTIAYSPDKKYYLDTYSQINIPPVIELRRSSDGKKISEIERTDVTEYLKAGFRFAEPFYAKGRDGKTDIWGVVFRPASFDSTKSYPVIENIYAGPQDAFVPKSFTTGGEMQSLAELGFIVVQIDGMGTCNRSKAFHDVCWHNLADAGFPDRILWIKALAEKYPYVDANRVGLYGTSAGGQNSLGGLLFHPEFYSAAVSACGCHDNRVDKQWWNEQWMGYPVGKHYEEQSNVTNAYKLKGNLLLIVGEADTNVPPESTYRVADALIKAKKHFDFLAIPGLGHSDGGPYGRVKKRDFFVKHLLGVDPPDRNK